jgi:hypothetical protein
MDDAELWRRIESSGPLEQYATFDPLSVDDVLQAERAATQYERRRAFYTDYAWAVPTPEAIALVAQAVGGRATLEVGAGKGLWARLLASAGVPVLATDAIPPVQPWHSVEVFEAREAVRRHPERQALLLIWPPFRDPCAYEALAGFGGDLVVYVGDVRFTGDAAFHQLLSDAWDLMQTITLPSWPGTDDAVHIHRRRRGNRPRIARNAALARLACLAVAADHVLFVDSGFGFGRGDSNARPLEPIHSELIQARRLFPEATFGEPANSS